MQKKDPCPGRVRESLVHVIKWLQGAISGPEKCVVPVIAAISGQCIGGAVDLITACDMRYCTDDAVFCIKETDLAMVADIGTLQRLPGLIGDMQCRELTYTGREFSGKEAEKLGLVLKSFSSHADMHAHIADTAAAIAAKSPLTIRGIKSTLLYTRDHTVEDSLQQVCIVLSLCVCVCLSACFCMWFLHTCLFSHPLTQTPHSLPLLTGATAQCSASHERRSDGGHACYLHEGRTRLQATIGGQGEE